MRAPVHIRFWGTRGSIAAPVPLTQRYGGNTPCVEVRVGDLLIILDCGTGIQPLGNSLLKEFKGKPIEGHIFIGHTHWDHIQGFPFFTPLYIPGNAFKVYGLPRLMSSFEAAMRNLMSPDFFPVSFDELGCKPKIVELDGPVQLGPVKISYHFLNHPGVTVGYRLQGPDWAVVYLSDHEPYGKLNEKGAFSDKADAEVAEFAKDCDVLICEAQYSAEEYRAKKSWGHSTFEDVIDLAAKARCKRLALFHHDPSHSDEMMDRFVEECRGHVRKAGQHLDCFGAQEGMELSL